jgi:hypothetical protein
MLQAIENSTIKLTMDNLFCVTGNSKSNSTTEQATDDFLCVAGNLGELSDEKTGNGRS